MKNTISSENLDRCLEYTYDDKISASEYASFIRFLVMTMKKELPIEILNNDNDTIIKGQITSFSIDYNMDEEGENDDLTLNLATTSDKESETIRFINTGRMKVSKDSKNGSRTFYRFYIYAENNEEGYRCTFNRRVTKK